MKDTGIGTLDANLLRTNTENAMGLAKRFKIDGVTFDVDDFLIKYVNRTAVRHDGWLCKTEWRVIWVLTVWSWWMRKLILTRKKGPSVKVEEVPLVTGRRLDGWQRGIIDVYLVLSSCEPESQSMLCAASLTWSQVWPLASRAKSPESRSKACKGRHPPGNSTYRSTKRSCFSQISRWIHRQCQDSKTKRKLYDAWLLSVPRG